MGRNSRRSESADTVVTVRLTEAETQELRNLMKRYGTENRSDIIRRLVGLAAADFDPCRVTDPRSRLTWWLDDMSSLRLGEDQVLLAKHEFLRTSTAEEILPRLLDWVRAYVACHGWPMPPCEEGTEAVLAQVRAYAVEGPAYSGRGRTGVNFLKSRFRSYWSTHRGPVETITDTPRLERLLRHMLGLSSARKPVDFTWSNFRRAFSDQHIAVSFFRPCVAAGIYRRWAGSAPNPVVWDPSAGFGARMLGFFSVFPEGTYHANEPASMTHLDLSTLAQEMPGQVNIVQQGSEFARWEQNSLDFVFTSPPYFDVERYFLEPGQAWMEYPSKESWIKNQVTPTIQASYEGLKPGKFAVFNINEAHRDAYLETALSVGFQFVTEEYLELNRSALARSGSNVSPVQTEPVLVFRRP